VDPIRSIFSALLRALLPSSGRHRMGNGVAHRLADQCTDVPAVQPTVPVAVPMLRGEDIGHVRPYLVAHERKQEAQRQRARRRAVWLALHGVDVGSRVIHGVRVAG
jgi:hypothetical protein